MDQMEEMGDKGEEGSTSTLMSFSKILMRLLKLIREHIIITTNNSINIIIRRHMEGLGAVFSTLMISLMTMKTCLDSIHSEIWTQVLDFIIITILKRPMITSVSIMLSIRRTLHMLMLMLSRHINALSRHTDVHNSSTLKHNSNIFSMGIIKIIITLTNTQAASVEVVCFKDCFWWIR